MNIKDSYVHVGPSGDNAKALLKHFEITASLITLTRAILNDAGTGDKTETITIPTWNLSTTGNAATATLADKVKGSYTGNGGLLNPNYFGTSKVGFLMMNTTVNGNTQYKDWIIMDCYNGNDVGGGVAFGVNRQSLGAYIMRSASARTSWELSAELLGTHNYNLYAVPLSGGTMTGALTVPSLLVTGAATFSQAINGSILGNAATASRLQNARTISLTGSVTGSGSFDGSGNLSIATTTNHTHQYVNTIGKSGSTITWAINGTAQTALDFSTTFAPYNADGYLPLTGGTLAATKAWASAVLTVNNNLDATWVTTTNFLTPNLTAAHYNCIMVGHDTTTNNNAGHLSFYYAGSGSANNRMALAFLNNVDILVVRADRKVGICTTAPTHVLHTVGDTYSSTYIEAGTYLKSGSYMQATTYVRASGNDLYIGSASGSQCHQQYDNTNKVLKFIFD